jgi:inositol transport system substrate-binding protein
MLMLGFSCNEKKSDKVIIGVSMLSMQNEFIQQVADALEKSAATSQVELIIVDAERSSLKQVEQVAGVVLIVNFQFHHDKKLKYTYN